MLTLLIIALVVMVICSFILINYVLPGKAGIIPESLATAAAIVMIVASVAAWVGLIGTIVDHYNKGVVDKKVASYEVNIYEGRGG